MPGSVYFTKTEIGADAFQKEHKLNDSCWIQDTALAMTTYAVNHSCKDYLVAINLNKTKHLSKNEVYGLLAHEALHVVQGICENMREERMGNEVSAYLLQSICIFLFDQVGKKNARK